MAEEMSWHSLREFTREGLMVALPLCFPGQSEPPPAGETAIKVMALNGYTDTLYMGTEGEKAHLLAGLIHQDTGVVHDMGTVPDATSVDALSVLGEDVRFLASGPGGARRESRALARRGGRTIQCRAGRANFFRSRAYDPQGAFRRRAGAKPPAAARADLDAVVSRL